MALGTVKVIIKQDGVAPWEAMVSNPQEIIIEDANGVRLKVIDFDNSTDENIIIAQA